MKIAMLFAGGVLLVGTSWGQVIDDPLHGCIIGTDCTDNGTVTPTTNPLPTFTFTVSPGPNTGDFLVDILVPNNVVGGASENFTVGATDAGSANTSTIGPDTATYEGDWMANGLGAYLGLTLASGSPKNDISAWLPYTQANGDSGATGYYVYQVDLGTNTLQQPGIGTEPVLTLGGTSSLPIASLLTGFLEDGTSGNYISDANSGAIFEADAPPAGGTVPEPASILLTGTISLFAMAALRRKVQRRS